MQVWVYNKSERTDLIGETLIHLRDVIIPGGGNELWHRLHYKGKYAGEIRIQTIYYEQMSNRSKDLDSTRQIVAEDVTDDVRDAVIRQRDAEPVAEQTPLPVNPRRNTINSVKEVITTMLEWEQAPKLQNRLPEF